ncbi:hypothetical protein BCR37DRAFT_394618 [Protomyces lactucae-debilis]|uniref:Chromo domain-containing protein n=1 Tax=Protomyces lactucae-debilis TaxID=2754530 RepID=A0A1Y2F2J6_PROLT|nr:uncharacterized protein BCR37DRAFT_394618 [Protomyces lactucae-debilis]ORY78108.1 hypothetical protein BCR37DRAFT_394618 [Protomyces lactucae-debilis]
MAAAASPASHKKAAEGSAFTAVNNSPAKADVSDDALKRKRQSSPSSHKTTPRAKKKAKAEQGWQPPKHLDSWEGLAEITAVTNNEWGRLQFALLWNGGQTSMHPATLVNVKMPQTVISYYESNLVLEGSQEAEQAELSGQDDDQDSIPEVMQSDDEEEEEAPSKRAHTSSSKTKRRESASQKTPAVKPSPATTAKSSPSKAASSAKGTPTKGKARTKPKVKESYWEIEDIVDDRIRNGKKQYRVRWVGYSARHDTWVPEEHSLEDCPEAVQEYLERKAEEAAAAKENAEAAGREEFSEVGDEEA